MRDPILEALEMDEGDIGNSDSGIFGKYIKEDDNVGFFGVDEKPGKPESKKKTLTENQESEESDEYISLQDKKITQEIKRLKIANNKELNNLVELKLVISVIGEIGQSVKSHIVDQSKRKSKQWADLLGIPERERELEKLLEDLGEEEISGFQADIKKFMDDGLWEK